MCHFPLDSGAGLKVGAGKNTSNAALLKEINRAAPFAADIKVAENATCGLKPG